MQVDFYILGDNSRRDIHQMVCRLCEKALEQEMNVFIYAKSEEQAQQLDDFLWTYKAESFIAHTLYTTDLESEPKAMSVQGNYTYPVVITAQTNMESLSLNEIKPYNHLLINLTHQIPPFYKQFQRIAELVGKETEEKEEARVRFRSYRQNNCQLNKFDL